MVDTKITAIYCRVACKDDDVIFSQERYLRDYARKQGFKNIYVYADNGCNGLDFNRPGRHPQNWVNGIISEGEKGERSHVTVEQTRTSPH